MENTSMGFTEAVKICNEKAFTFKGRARRSEYWWWILFSSVIGFVMSIIIEAIPEGNTLLTGIYGLAEFAGYIYLGIATFAVTVRRLHDIGHSGWWKGADIIARFVWAIWLFVEILAFALNTDVEVTAISILGEVLVKLVVSSIPFIIYSIILLIWYCTDSQSGTNKYGESPKGI